MALKIAEAFVEITAKNNTEAGLLATKAFAARKGQEIADALMSPLQRMKSQMGRLFDLQKAGANMSPETMSGAVKAIAQQYRDATGATALFAERQARAAQAFDSSRTALEKYLSRLSELKNQKVKGDIDADVYGRQVAAAKSTYQADTGITGARAAEQSRLNQLLMTGVTPLQLYNKDLALLNRLLKNGEIDQKNYAVGVRAAKAAMGGGGAGGRGGMVATQLSYGIQDAIAGGATGGLRGALLGSANNISQAATLAFGPWTAAIIGVGAGLGSILIPKLLEAFGATRSLKMEIVDFTASVNDLNYALSDIEFQEQMKFDRADLATADIDTLAKQKRAFERDKSIADQSTTKLETERSNAESEAMGIMREEMNRRQAESQRANRDDAVDPATAGYARAAGVTLKGNKPLTDEQVDAMTKAARFDPKFQDAMKKTDDELKASGMTQAEVNFVATLKRVAEIEEQIAKKREESSRAGQKLGQIGEFMPGALDKAIDKAFTENSKADTRYSEKKAAEQDRREKSMTNLERALGVETSGSKFAQAFAGIESKVAERFDSIAAAFPEGGKRADDLRARVVKAGTKEAEDFLKPQRKQVGQMVGIEGLAKQIQLAAVNNDQAVMKDQLKELKLLTRKMEELTTETRKKQIAYLS